MHNHQPKVVYDKYSSHFTRLNVDNQSDVSRGYAANVETYLPSDKRSRILDYGCGLGHFLLYLNAKGYENVEGIDISSSQVEICHQRGANNATCVAEPLEWLAARSSTYDFAGSFDVVEHIPKSVLVPSLSAIRESLKPGGKFVCRVPNIAAPVGPYSLYRDITHEWCFAEESLLQVLELAGFSEIQILPEVTIYRRKILGLGFEVVRKGLYALTKVVHKIQSPGSVIPQIYTGNLYAVSRR